MSEAKAESQKQAKDNLLVLSKFLRAAAAKRQGGDETSAENRAFEGALLLVYGGEVSAVVAMEQLIAGSDEKVPTVDQVASEFTCRLHKSVDLRTLLRCCASIKTSMLTHPTLDKQIKELAFEYAPYAAEEAWAEEVAQSEPAPPTAEESSVPVQTDPTIAYAGLTEMVTEAEPASNGVAHHMETPTVPEASNIDAGAANAAAGTNWDASADTGADGWVEIPRDPAETDTGTAATPAALSGTQSWAEDVPTEPTPAPVASGSQPNANGGDGFHEVHHGRGRGRGGPQGEFRGGHRGRGFRGDRGGEGGGYRGGEGGYRGRGAFRGDRGDRGGGEGGHRGRGRGGFRGNHRGRGEGPPQ